MTWREAIMPTPLGAFAVGEAIAASTASVRRRWFGWLWKNTEEITLTHGDIERLEVVLSELHGKPIGTDASWDNPKSRNSGSVRLLERMTYNGQDRSEEHTSELQSPYDLVCRLLLEKKKKPT